MGIFEIRILAETSATYTVVSGPTTTNCSTEQVITVNHGGANKHVYIQSSSNAVPITSIDETITADKTYNLILSGSNATNPTVTSSITMVIRDLTAAGTILAIINLSRKWNGNQC